MEWKADGKLGSMTEGKLNERMECNERVLLCYMYCGDEMKDEIMTMYVDCEDGKKDEIMVCTNKVWKAKCKGTY